MKALRKNELARCLTALAHALIATSENTLQQNDGQVPPAIVADWMRANDLGDWGSVDVQDALDEVCAATAHNDFSAKIVWRKEWVGLQVYRDGFPRSVIGRIDGRGEQAHNAVVHWTGAFLPGVLPIAELRLADTDEPLTEYKPWWKEEWRGVEVSPYDHPEVVGTVLGPWEHANWVQVGWVQGCEQPTNWHMCELQRADGRPFYVS